MIKFKCIPIKNLLTFASEIRSIYWRLNLQLPTNNHFHSQCTASVVDAVFCVDRTPIFSDTLQVNVLFWSLSLGLKGIVKLRFCSLFEKFPRTECSSSSPSSHCIWKQSTGKTPRTVQVRLVTLPSRKGPELSMIGSEGKADVEKKEILLRSLDWNMAYQSHVSSVCF